MEQKISVKRILVDLISIMPQIERDFKSKERYSQLIGFLSSKDYYEDEDLAYPTLKEIEAKTGLKTHQIRKQLKEIYEQLFDREYTFDFNQVEIYFYVEYFKRYASVKCSNLTYLPKVGENIVFSFLKAKVGTNYFYVEDIQHHFEDKKQLIFLFLKGGFFNNYWYYRKHKAIELGEIGRGEIGELYEYELKRRLGLRG
jgi:hypothetical protein